MGSIQKRPKRYQAQVRRHGLQAVSRTFTTKKDALVWVWGIEARINVGETNIATPKAINLGDLLKRYRDEVSPQKKGALTEIRRLDQLLKDAVSKTLCPNLQVTLWQRLEIGGLVMGYGLRTIPLDLEIIFATALGRDQGDKIKWIELT